MKKVQIGGRAIVLLSTREYMDLLEAVECYVTGATAPEADVDPEIRAFYPTERFTAPVDERWWRLHASMANNAPRGEGGSPSGTDTSEL